MDLQNDAKLVKLDPKDPTSHYDSPIYFSAHSQQNMKKAMINGTKASMIYKTYS